MQSISGANSDRSDNCSQRSVVTDSVSRGENPGDDDLGSSFNSLFRADSDALSENNDAEQMKELAKLKKRHERFQCAAEIRQLCAVIANGYNNDVVGPLFAKRQKIDKDLLAIEQAKEIKKPDIYFGKNQKALDWFVRQTKITFWMKPSIYSTDED